MRSRFRKVVTNTLFNQKKEGEEGEEGEVSWTRSMPLVTPFAWRCASRGSFPEGLWKGAAMAKAGGVTQRLRGVCFKGSFKAVEATVTVPMAKGPSPSLAPSPGSLGSSCSVSPPLGITRSHPHPHSQATSLFRSFRLCQRLSLLLLPLLFSLPLPPRPQPHCPHTGGSAAPWSPQVPGPPLLPGTKSCGPHGNTSSMARPRLRKNSP